MLKSHANCIVTRQNCLLNDRLLSKEEAETPAIDFNQQSRDSSKEDDIQAICEQRGFGRNPPLALQLKAIDQEYHHLLESQQSDRCEYVQKLYAWKSKQATQV